MIPEKDWADVLADELLDLAVNRELMHKLIATRLRTIKIEAQSEAIREATENVKRAFDEFSVGGGDK